ncbi:MAG: hypothetical protein PUJ80_03940 [Verrucomicrobiota bacterium]|nr:hypothetical protein [Verrucomicrobiota bacterium]
MASKRIVFSAVVCFGMSAAISAASNETVEWQRMIDAAASAGGEKGRSLLTW